MGLDLPHILIVIAAAQGSLLAVLLFQKHRALFANRFLAMLLFCYTGVLVHLLLQDAGLYGSHRYLFLLSGLALAAMPLHYLYTSHLIHRSRRFRRIEILHFIPFALYEGALAAAIAGGALDFPPAGAFGLAETPAILLLYNAAVIGLGLAYLGLSLLMIRRYNSRVKEVASSTETLQLNWLRNITVMGLAAILLFCLEEVLLIGGTNLSSFILSSVGFALYVYGMGYLGLLKSEVFSDRKVERAMQTVEEIASTREETASAKYERSGLSGEAAEVYLSALLTVMKEEKSYRNNALTLTELSEALSVSPHNLSEVINTKLGMNFYDFVNGYRLEEAKQGLADPTKQHLKILSIAFDAGFNSKATFNTLFKERTGKTPSEYRKSLHQPGSRRPD
jgi:AraC-like DNA-binding protein